MSKRNFSSLTLREAMQMVAATRLLPWELQAPPRAPSPVLDANLQRLRVFDLQNSEAAKILLIDVLFAEIVPEHPPLKIWKSATLDSESLTGIADYLFTPSYAYPATPLLCVAEAKRDDFVQGRAQCVAEMIACGQNNRLDGNVIDVFGIVSNGQDWQFYRLSAQNELFETDPYTMRHLPELLGALDFVCAQCARNAPADG